MAEDREPRAGLPTDGAVEAAGRAEPAGARDARRLRGQIGRGVGGAAGRCPPVEQQVGGDLRRPTASSIWKFARVLRAVHMLRISTPTRLAEVPRPDPLVLGDELAVARPSRRLI